VVLRPIVLMEDVHGSVGHAGRIGSVRDAPRPERNDRPSSLVDDPDADHRNQCGTVRVTWA
jgi:hypothetical protein